MSFLMQQSTFCLYDFIKVISDQFSFYTSEYLFIRNFERENSLSRPVHKCKQIRLLTSLKTVHPATTRNDEALYDPDLLLQLQRVRKNHQRYSNVEADGLEANMRRTLRPPSLNQLGQFRCLFVRLAAQY